MPQTEIAKKHHFIPEFYLKRWAGSDRKVAEYQKPYAGVVKVRRVFPSATGYAHLGYALPGAPAALASMLEEQFFKPVDTRAALALDKMDAGTTAFTEAERVAWGQFLLSLVHRQPHRIERLRELMQGLTLKISKSDQRRWREGRRAEDPKLLVDAVRSDWEQDADGWQRRSLKMMINSICSEKVGSHIINMRWGMLLLPPQVPAIMTSDMPVHWYGPLISDGCHMLLPIGPKRIFYAVNQSNMENAIRALPPEKMVNFINEQSVRRAVKYVYAMSEGHVDFVQKRMGVEPLPNTGDAAYTAPTPKMLKRLKRDMASTVTVATKAVVMARTQTRAIDP